jgi:hypothetical protein
VLAEQQRMIEEIAENYRKRAKEHHDESMQVLAGLYLC